MTDNKSEPIKIIVSWDIADGGSEWCIQFWQVNKDESQKLIQQIDKNSDDSGCFDISNFKSHPLPQPPIDKQTESIDKNKGDKRKIIGIAGTKSDVWGLDNFGNIYRLDAGYWTEMQGIFNLPIEGKE